MSGTFSENHCQNCFNASLVSACGPTDTHYFPFAAFGRKHLKVVSMTFIVAFTVFSNATENKFCIFTLFKSQSSETLVSDNLQFLYVLTCWCRTDPRSHDRVPGEAPSAAWGVYAPRAGGTGPDGRAGPDWGEWTNQEHGTGGGGGKVCVGCRGRCHNMLQLVAFTEQIFDEFVLSCAEVTVRRDGRPATLRTRTHARTHQFQKQDIWTKVWCDCRCDGAIFIIYFFSSRSTEETLMASRSSSTDSCRSKVPRWTGPKSAGLQRTR